MDSYSKRKNIILLIFLLVGGIFLVRLFMLQVIDKTYKKTATNNVLREVVDYPSRGLIYDRKGKLIVHNQAAYDLLATPREISAFDTTALCSILNIDKQQLVNELQKAAIYSKLKPSVIVKQISPERYALLQEKMYKYPGFYMQARTLRKYNYDLASHVLGYVGEVGPSHIKNDQYYRAGDYIGITGIEKTYEKYLRGQKGVSFYMVDVHNRVKGSYDQGNMDVSPVKGNDLIITLDADLQQYGEELMQNKRGSIVAIEPSTGEILMMVSSPGYKPSAMVGRMRNENYPLLIADTLLPMYNRAVRALYPPGSTFKMLNALIALQDKVITPRTKFRCNHGYHVGSFSMGCHHDGDFHLAASIAQSCNAYYAYTFRYILEAPKYNDVKEGYEAWRNYVLSFGFAKNIAPEISDELPGFIPTSDYYQERVFPYSRWRALPIISLSIGQGEIQSTPLQMANYTAAIANRGYYFTPHFLKQVVDVNENVIQIEKHQTLVDSAYFDDVIEGMAQVMSETHLGTARASNIPGIEMCGKTGTAENPHGIDHSTFVAFAPRKTPKIAISVYVENGKWGSTFAAPIASLIVEKYLNDSIQESRKHIEKNMMEANLLFPDKPNFQTVE
ncbi:MAG: penicillin-binding protein 2 [Prolixibacteraceae bacterium]|nr:penicillin-binding protein 2 [Prolixibacteraceae bacterium]